MRLYGIASRCAGAIQEWFESRDEAESVLELVLAEAREYEDDLYVTAVEFELSPN